jgi:hypothetical protein
MSSNTFQVLRIRAVQVEKALFVLELDLVHLELLGLGLVGLRARTPLTQHHALINAQLQRAPCPCTPSAVSAE